MSEKKACVFKDDTGKCPTEQTMSRCKSVYGCQRVEGEAGILAEACAGIAFDKVELEERVAELEEIERDLSAKIITLTHQSDS